MYDFVFILTLVSLERGPNVKNISAKKLRGIMPKMTPGGPAGLGYGSRDMIGWVKLGYGNFWHYSPLFLKKKGKNAEIYPRNPAVRVGPQGPQG